MTSATSSRVGRETFNSPVLSTIARSVGATSRPTPRTLHLVEASTPGESSDWRFGWSWKTDCRTERPRGICGGTTASSSPSPQSRTGRKRRGKKGVQYDAYDAQDKYLDWALGEFSGYVAVDELYDGPFCVLSAVDNRTFRRLIYEVLDHPPTQADIRRFLERLKTHVQARQKRISGVTNHGRFPVVPRTSGRRSSGGPSSDLRVPRHRGNHQGDSQGRDSSSQGADGSDAEAKLARGRPTTPEAKRKATQKRRLQERVQLLFKHRYLFVQHDLSSAEQATLRKITRGIPLLRILRTLRQIMDEVYRLFDRRCRTETALARLACLRVRVGRLPKVAKILRKLFSPSLEKALTFLDDSLLPATSNAVERANRRYRKVQKTVYRVRTRRMITGRIALDMLRDQHGPDRARVLRFLHQARAG